MSDAFTKKGLDAPRLSAEMLLAHVFGCDRMKLYTDADRPASPLERESLRDLVGRALKNEPVQYLVGEKWFFGLPLHVDRRVLIPRPSTETIVEEVLLHSRAEPGFGGKTGEGIRFADVCTGSGCVAVALLKNMPKAFAIATDISEDALAVARQNAERHRVADRLEFLKGNLVDPLINHPAGGSAGRDLHYLLANPPYIPDSEWEAVEANVKEYEPHGALRGGPDGLTFVRPIIDQGAEVLRPGGVMMIEVATATTDTVKSLIEQRGGFGNVRIVKDGDGLARVAVAARTE